MGKQKPINFIMLVVLALIWGSSFILIKKGLLQFSPLQVGSLRLVIAGIALLSIGFRELFKFQKKDILPLIFVGLVGSGIPSILFAIAQTKVASATTGAMNSLTPLFTFLIGFLLFKTKFNVSKIGGVLLGLCGALTLILGTSAGTNNFNIYAVFIIIATLCYATSVNVVKNYLQNVPSTTITLCSFLFVFPIFIPILISTDIQTVFINATPSTWYSFGAIALLAIVGTAFANIVFFKLTQNSSALFAASVTYLIPIVATFWGLADGELLGVNHFAGLFLVISGVYLVGRN